MTNVVWLFIDSLRKDIFDSTETLMKKEIFEKGINLTNCFSQGGWTYPSFGSFITGKYPTSNGMTILDLKSKNKEKTKWPWSDSRLPRLKGKTIFDILSKKNFKLLTICHPILGEDYDYEGWNRIKENELSIADILDWIGKNKDNNFFLFIRTDITHASKWPGFKESKYEEVTDLVKKGIKDDVKKFKKLMISCLKKIDDGFFSPLFKKLNEIGLVKDTIFIINADHGDTLGEALLRTNNIHKGDYQVLHTTCFDEVIKVPCAIRYDKKIQKRNIALMTRLIDILPTILCLIELEKEYTGDGKNLLKEEDLNSITYSYGESSNSVYLRNYSEKLIFYPKEKKVLLFDLKEDPLENKPLNDINLQKKMFGILDKEVFKGKFKIDSLKLIDEEIIKNRLRNLGYTD